MTETNTRIDSERLPVYIRQFERSIFPQLVVDSLAESCDDCRPEREALARIKTKEYGHVGLENLVRLVEVDLPCAHMADIALREFEEIAASSPHLQHLIPLE